MRVFQEPAPTGGCSSLLPPTGTRSTRGPPPGQSGGSRSFLSARDSRSNIRTVPATPQADSGPERRPARVDGKVRIVHPLAVPLPNGGQWDVLHWDSLGTSKVRSTTLTAVGRSERCQSRGVPDPVAEAQARARFSSYSPGSPQPMEGFHRYRASLRRSRAWPLIRTLLLAILSLVLIAVVASYLRIWP
jgi:hypothetical protein